MFSASLTGLAGAFRRLVRADAGHARAAIVDAFVAIPGVTPPARRETRPRCCRAIPGAIGKAGAEACYAVALPDGRAVAMKIEDGYPRARPSVMAAALRADGDSGVATRSPPRESRPFGGGEPVGELRPVF